MNDDEEIQALKDHAARRLDHILIGCTDAQVWAREFCALVADRIVEIDEGLMLGWFANAIMAGYDDGMAKERRRSFDDKVREIAFQAAGAGAGAVMQKAPTVVMPDREIAASVDRLLAEHGVEGYPTDVIDAEVETNEPDPS